MQLMIFFEENEFVPGFVGLSVSDVGSWKGPGPGWPASSHRACCGDAVVAKLCTVDDSGVILFLR